MKIIFLGTAQDGGIPQIGCNCFHCKSNTRTAASIVIDSDEDCIVLDVTPDFRQQYITLNSLYDKKISALYLTHAHWGHYGGLPLLGKEAWNVKNLKVFLSRKFYSYLNDNEPFRSMFQRKNLIPEIIEDGEMTCHNIEPVRVPHRDEFSDTYGFIIKSYDKKILYLPCFDLITNDLEQKIDAMDLTILDGTFFSNHELKGRDIKKIPHPRIEDSIEMFKSISDRVIFTHLNHSNPVVDKKSEQYRIVRDAGFRVADDWDEINISEV